MIIYILIFILLLYVVGINIYLGKPDDFFLLRWENLIVLLLYYIEYLLLNML